MTRPSLPSIAAFSTDGNGDELALAAGLFAIGYAASFHGSLKLVAARRGIAAAGAEVEVAVSFERDPADGLLVLAARVRVRMPGVPRRAAAQLVRNAERVCPYTRMAREGIASIVTLAGQEAR